MIKTLIIGYGNIDRQDDGVAWHVMKNLAATREIAFPEEPSDELPPEKDGLTFYFSLQLTPEMSEEIVEYDRVCFIDAHTGNIPTDIQVLELSPQFQNSPFTHHLTPESLLSFCESIYNKCPNAILVSIRGYEFDFTQMLSSRTQKLVGRAVSKIDEWL